MKTHAQIISNIRAKAQEAKGRASNLQEHQDSMHHLEHDPCPEEPDLMVTCHLRQGVPS